MDAQEFVNLLWNGVLESCNEDDKITRGAIVRIERHPEVEPRIVGEPAYVLR